MKTALMILCLALLTACTPKTVYVDRYVERPPAVIPDAPTFFPVQWISFDAARTERETYYCVDEAGAKSLLKNFLIVTEYAESLRTIVRQ